MTPSSHDDNSFSLGSWMYNVMVFGVVIRMVCLRLVSCFPAGSIVQVSRSKEPTGAFCLDDFWQNNESLVNKRAIIRSVCRMTYLGSSMEVFIKQQVATA